MDNGKIRVVLDDLGLSEGLVDLPIIMDAIDSARAMHGDTEDIAQFIEVTSPTHFRIGSATFNFRDDGTIRVDRAGFSGHYIANRLGIEVEHIREQDAEGERKVVRRDGLLVEVKVTDQGETEIGTSKTLDNGNPIFHHAYGGKQVRYNGRAFYFNPEDVLNDFDRNARRLQYGTVEQQNYRRELRIKVEQAMQDEKISRLPLNKQVEALRDIKDDLEREYKYLCDIIELDLSAHRTNLDFIQKIARFPKLKNGFADKINEYKQRVAKQRIKPDEYGEIYPRILPYSYAEDKGQPDEIRLQAERNALEEKIYVYRKRNAELRARHDRTTEMLRAMVPVYNAVADEHYPKGFVINALFSGILERYERDSKAIRQAKEERCEAERIRTASIKKARKDKKERAKFDARRREEKKVVTPGSDSKIEEKVTPKPQGKGLDDGDNDQK